MSERYKPAGSNYPESWIAALGEISGLSQIHLLRHKLRLKRNADRSWEDLIPSIERQLAHHWGNIQITNAVNPRENRRKLFDLPEKYHTKKRVVYEGVLHARTHPMARALYSFPGITTLILQGDILTVKRAYAFSWQELEPKIRDVLYSQSSN